MTTRETLMLNPFDGLLLASGSGVFATFLLALGSSPVLAAVITGSFMLLGKLIEIWWKNRTDRRVRELRRQLREQQLRDTTAPTCTRQPKHTGPCNGFPSITCATFPQL